MTLSMQEHDRITFFHGELQLFTRDRCINCNQPTAYSPHDPIDLREYYILGAGQLCHTCYDEIYKPHNKK